MKKPQKWHCEIYEESVLYNKNTDTHHAQARSGTREITEMDIPAPEVVKLALSEYFTIKTQIHTCGIWWRLQPIGNIGYFLRVTQTRKSIFSS